MGYSVGRVAALSKVTVRTLHHYDQIGLLVPSGRSPAGHRRYDDADLDRLQQVLFYRELGFPLEQIGPLLDDPEVSPTEQLRHQHQLLVARIERLEQMAIAVENAMEAKKMGVQLTPEEKFEIFGDGYSEEYAREAEERWGDTDAWRESQRRAASLSKDDWQRVKDEMDDLHNRLAAALDRAVPADAPEAMDLAEERRAHISRWSYECGYAMHRDLGQMYVTDERFTATYEGIRSGLAAYVAAAIHANAERHGHT